MSGCGCWSATGAWLLTPGSDQNQTFTGAALYIASTGDSIAQVALAIRPSGSGELQPVDLAVDGSNVIAQLSGGVAGREYMAQFVVTFASGAVIVYDQIVVMSETNAIWPIPYPASFGFGPSINWTSGVRVLGPPVPLIENNITLTGTTQATAYQIGAVTSVITEASSDTGVVLPEFINAGTVLGGVFSIQNLTSLYWNIWPPPGAQIITASGTLAANAPATISPGQDLAASSTDPQVLWAIA